MENQDRGDIYSRITADIIAAIEAGATNSMPWHHDGSSTSRPINVVSNKPYRGINTLALWAAATHRGLRKRHLGNVSAMEYQGRSGASR